MFLIFIIIIVIAIIVIAFSIPPSDNKSLNQNDNNTNAEIDDFIIFDMINKNRKQLDKYLLQQYLIVLLFFYYVKGQKSLMKSKISTFMTKKDIFAIIRQILQEVCSIMSVIIAMSNYVMKRGEKIK